ncbi:hypothetical protein CIG75_09560 [Tumebacillus algifaecis]|uniref:Uncharacterized protein n=1 Tax=Tumebacillus algifaecis TaxID=1214604 RepID=A0A223D1A1_9BACL|nr:hypothetical protein [Tumebacillus algifaecis]ASS75203.1 hypothetical protein CIG75_09560 [Tumebacillus algifaecis]
MFQPPVQTQSSSVPISTPIQGQSERPAQSGLERRSPGADGAPLSAAHILQLQRTHGNRAVAQMLQKQDDLRQKQGNSSDTLQPR